MVSLAKTFIFYLIYACIYAKVDFYLFPCVAVVDASVTLLECSSLASGLLIVGGAIVGTILATPISILATCRYFKRNQRKTKEER